MKTLSDLGERRIIKVIQSLVSSEGVAVGIGDDCAVFDQGDQHLLLTTDMITQETHIPDEMTAYQQGWFVVAINLSDIAAMGGTPIGVVLSLGLPAETADNFVQELMKGANDCAVKYGTVIAGGDTKENPHVTLCGTALGKIGKRDHLLLRKGAQPGDAVVVTGSLGKAAAGYYTLQQNNHDKDILRGLFEPTPRIQEGRILSQSGVVTSCMDVSDGLSSSLYQLQEQNQVGYQIQKEKLPLASALSVVSSHKKQIEYALHFGGDYELLFTLPQEQLPMIQQQFKSIGTRVTCIGTVTDDNNINLVYSEKTALLPNKGYEHFKPHTVF